MQTNFQINISNPCHEAWEDFKATPEGGFCASCQTNVINFSDMTESQLVAYFRDLSKSLSKFIDCDLSLSLISLDMRLLN